MHKLLVLVIFILIAGNSSGQPLLTLEDAVTLGLQNNFDIRIARNQQKIAENNTGKGLAGFLPKVDLNGTISQVDNKQELDLPVVTSNNDINSLNAEVVLNWTLFDGFKMFVNNSTFKSQAELGKMQARDQIENIIVQISQAYFNLSQQDQLYRVALETKQISATRLEREKVRNEIGGASSTDLYNAQVSYNNDQSSLLTRELTLSTAREQLNILLGRDPETAYTVTDEIEIPELVYDYEEIKRIALERNSSLEAARLNREIAEKKVKSAYAPFLPKVSLFARYGYADQTRRSDIGDYPGMDIGTTNKDATIGLNLSYNIFNGSSDKIDLQNARITANNQNLAQRDAQNKLVGSVKEIFDTYRQQLQIVQLEEANISAAQRNMEIQQELHELGAAGSLEFRDAQVRFAAARTALITARFQARISRLQIEKLIGMLETE